MRLWFKLGLCCLLVSSAFAQHRGGMGGGGHAGFSGGHAGFGGGHVGFTGGRIGGVGRGFYGGGRGFGFGRGFGYGRGFYHRRFFDRDFYRGFWGWPWFYGAAWWPGWWDYGWDWPNDYGYDNSYPYVNYPYAGYNTGPNVTVVYPAPAETAYPVVVHAPVRPAVHEYRRPEDYGLPEEHSNRPILYLIAFRDKVIRAAMAYWTEGDTLHYLDTDHKEMRAPLASVDHEFSVQLNHERHVPFRLP